MNDKQILSGLRKKEQKALETLMDRYISYVSAIVWNILRFSMSTEDAEEVVSDVFLAAWNQADDIREDYLKAWLGAVARNMSKNKLRGRSDTLPLEEDVLELPARESPDTLAQQKTQQQLVRRAVDSMGEPDREIFLRHYYYAQTVREIGMVLHMNEATVKTKLRRGRMRLKEILMRWDVR
ncbi:MAG: RNA polymerase sigma factor [Faecousia sp.]